MPPTDRIYYTLQILLIFIGTPLPMGELLGGWIATKIPPATETGTRLELKRCFAFQLSWTLMRWMVMLIAGSIIFLTYKNPLPNETSFSQSGEEVNIPGEPTSFEDPTILTQPKPTFPRTFEDRQADRPSPEQLERQLTLLPDLDKWVLYMMIAGTASMLLWFINMLINLINVFRVRAGHQPFYPMTWPWLLRFENKKG